MRVDKGTDLASQKYEDNGAWEEFMNDDESEVATQPPSDEPQPSTTRRIRPPNQTEEEKKAWDEEEKLIKNTKAREIRARKKAEKETQNLSTSFNNLTIAPSPSPPSNSLSQPFLSLPPSPLSLSSTSPPSPPRFLSLESQTMADLTNRRLSQRIGRILRLRVPEAMRDRIWAISDSDNTPCTLQRSKTSRRSQITKLKTTSKAEKTTSKAKKKAKSKAAAKPQWIPPIID